MTHDTPTDRSDDAPDPRLTALARDYHRPPAPPREEMWAEIAAARDRRRAEPRRIVVRHWRLGVGIAAILAVGVALGRWSATRPTAAPQPLASVLAYDIAATDLLSRTEVLLTSFRAGPRPEPDPAFHASARELLMLTRMMRDAPAASDPSLRTLLDDLELILAQIVQLDPRAPSPDAELITEGLEARGLLPRLRSAIPAGPAVGRAGVM